MRWYFDDQGVADGPHDGAAMAEARKAMRIKPETLVWHRDLPDWQQAAILNPPWWDHDVAVVQPMVQPLIRERSAEAHPHRRPVPKAPITPSSPSRGGLLQRWFGRSPKKG